MDNGKGQFIPISEAFLKEREEKRALTGLRPRPIDRIDQVFYIGEKIEIKGSKFTVRNIDHFTGFMILKLLPQKN